MHEGKHGILDDEKDLNEIFGKKKQHGHDNEHDHDHPHDNEHGHDHPHDNVPHR